MSRNSEIFYGTVEHGQFKPINDQRYFDFLNALEGKEVEATIGKRGKKRSDKQNRWYWGVAIKEISDHTGQERESIHEFLKKTFGLKAQLTFKLKDGQTIVRDVPMSTTKLLTTEFNDYKDKIQAWASTYLDVYIPDPKEVKMK